MKCLTPEISWHNRDPVLSIDIQQVSGSFYKVASGGADCHVILWYLYLKDDQYNNMDAVADLTKHQKSINVVRWAPSKNLLASGDDESVIILWHQKTDCDTQELKSEEFLEHWSVYKVLRGHLEDIYDLTWFADSSKIISGSVDNTVIIWDVEKGKKNATICGHNGFVQGVSLDPQNQVFATTCSDRNLRIYDAKSKKNLHKIDKAVLPFPEDHKLHNIPLKLFYDDTLKAFYRRLSFSPDGLFLAVPSGYIHNEDKTIKFNSTYLFSRHDFKQPVFCIPSNEQYSIAVRFCPVIFNLRSNRPQSLLPLPYRMVFAIALKNSVLICDTQHEIPLAKIMNIHYTRLTDLTWSLDGRVLIISSSDGFCSFVTFEKDELGTECEQFNKESLINSLTKPNQSEPMKVQENGSPVVKKIAIKRKPKPESNSNLLLSWTKKSKVSLDGDDNGDKC